MSINPEHVFRGMAIVSWGLADKYARRGILVAEDTVVTYVHGVPAERGREGERVTVYLANAIRTVVGAEYPAITRVFTPSGQEGLEATGEGISGEGTHLSSDLDYAVIRLPRKGLPPGVEPLSLTLAPSERLFAVPLSRGKGLAIPGYRQPPRDDVEGCPPPLYLIKLEQKGIYHGWSGTPVVDDENNVAGILISTSSKEEDTDYGCISPASEWEGLASRAANLQSDGG